MRSRSALSRVELCPDQFQALAGIDAQTARIVLENSVALKVDNSGLYLSSLNTGTVSLKRGLTQLRQGSPQACHVTPTINESHACRFACNPLQSSARKT